MRQSTRPIQTSRPAPRQLGLPTFCGPVFAFVLVLATGLGIAAEPSFAQKSDGEVEQLRKRVEQLEGQLVDLQVVIGTLESLATNPRRSPVASQSYGGGSGGGANAARIAALETQVQALSAQLARGGAQPAATNRSGGFAPAKPRGSFAGGFGQTTVTPSASRDPIGGLLSANQSGSRGGEISANAQYETAYGALLQQDYATAQTGFERFLQDHPRHELAGNAQFWLGETYFVQRNFNAAAKAFLKGYRTYSRSPKAPDSLLKLAMSLDRLGARDDACASFAAISERFPNAPRHVRNRATSEIRRLRC